MNEPAYRIIPAYLGWGNSERDAVGLRLYATDHEPPTAPRWDHLFKGGRVVEYPIVERFGQAEGDKFLIIHLGNRFLSSEVAEEVAKAIAALLQDMGSVLSDGG